MKKYFIFIGTIFAFFLILPSAFACQPCPEILNLEKTISKSDLIIVGQKISDGPRSDFGEGYGGPDWIEVKIIEILKGSTTNAKIKVNSWDTMCPYGIIVNDNKNYLMLLQKRENQEEDFQYDAVDFGCAEKSYLIEDNQIDLKGQKISLESFASRYGLLLPTRDSNKNQAKDKSGDAIQEQSLTPYYIIIELVVLVVLTFVLLKIIRKRK